MTLEHSNDEGAMLPEIAAQLSALKNDPHGSLSYEALLAAIRGI